jgi:hypothetical protein
VHQCKATPGPIVKGDKFGNYQCLQNQCQKDKKSVPYIRPGLELTTKMLGRYQINSGIKHCKAVMKAQMYLQGIKIVSC